MPKQFLSRYDYGSNVIKHKGVSVRTTLNSSFEEVYNRSTKDTAFDVAKCIQAVEHRPDSIAFIFYNTTSFWWYIQTFNGISDPFEGFNISDRILIPNVSI